MMVERHQANRVSEALADTLKAADWAAADTTAFHWRDRAGREVDLLFERRDGGIVAIECKLSATVGQPDFRHLEHLRDQLGDRFHGGAVVSLGSSTLSFGDRLWSVPVSALWS